MLARQIAGARAVSESSAEYNAADEYEYRDAEYEYETEGEPELSRAPESGLRPASNGQSIFPALVVMHKSESRCSLSSLPHWRARTSRWCTAEAIGSRRFTHLPFS